MSIFKQTSEALDKAIQQKKQADLVMKNIGGVVIDSLRPALENNARMIGEGFSQLAGAIKDIKVSAPDVPKASVEVKIPPITVPEPKVTVNVPEIKVPQINVPEVKLPPFPKIPTPQVTVNVPEFPKIPKLEWPEKLLEIQPIELKGYNLQNPVPVQLRDANGKPVSLDVTNIIGGGGRNIARIGGVDQSAYASMMNADGRLKVSVETGGSGLTDNELRATAVPVMQVSGESWSVNASVSTSPSDQTTDSIATRQVSGFVDSVYVLGAFGSSVVDGVFNADNRIRVSVETGGSGLTDTELRASSVPVEQVSGSVWSVSVTSAGVTSVTILNADGTYRDTFPVSGTVAVSGITNTVGATIVDSTGVGYSGSNPLPVSGSVTLSSESITLDHETDSIATRQVSGFVDSVYITGSSGTVYSQLVNADGTYRDTMPVQGSVAVTGITGSVGATILNGEGLARDSWLVSDVTASVKAALVDSTGVQYSGSNPVPITWVSGAGVSTAVTIQDSSGVGYSGSNPFPITIVTSATATVNTALTDSGGVQYSGSNPVPITGNVNVNGSLNSVLATGVTLHGAADTGDAPIKVGGVAVTTANPTAVAGGDRVRFTADELGRQLTRPVQVRDLMITAYATLTNGTETTLLAASAGSFHDLVYILGANVSDVATTVHIRPVTAGNIVLSLQLPANGTAGVAAPVPIPQMGADTGNNWTADMNDITGTTVYLTGLFTREV